MGLWTDKRTNKIRELIRQHSAYSANKGQGAFKQWQNRKCLQQKLVRVRNVAEVSLPLCQGLQKLRHRGWKLPFQESSGSWQWSQIWLPIIATSIHSTPYFLSAQSSNLDSSWLSTWLSFSFCSFPSSGREDLAQPRWLMTVVTYTTFLTFCS